MGSFGFSVLYKHVSLQTILVSVYMLIAKDFMTFPAIRKCKTMFQVFGFYSQSSRYFS